MIPRIKIENHGLSKCDRAFIAIAKFKEAKHVFFHDRAIIDLRGHGWRRRDIERTINPLGVPMKFVGAVPKRRIRKLPDNY